MHVILSTTAYLGSFNFLMLQNPSDAVIKKEGQELLVILKAMS